VLLWGILTDVAAAVAQLSIQRRQNENSNADAVDYHLPMETPSLLSGAEIVVESLGYWPTFHDAEVVRVVLERANPVEVGKASLRLAVHVRRYETRLAGTADYHLVLLSSALVHFHFEDLYELALSDFNHQNVINAISIKPVNPQSEWLWVEVESIWGLGASFGCSMASVERIEMLATA
jgi:hypothetical protein